MRRHVDPDALLNALLDSHQRRGGGSRAVTALPTLAFPDGAARAILEARLRAAEADGADATPYTGGPPSRSAVGGRGAAQA